MIFKSLVFSESTLWSILVIGLVCCQESTSKLSATDIEAIRSASQGWEFAYQQKDFDSLVNWYTPDAIMMPPNMPTISGRSNIKKFFVENESNLSIELEYEEIVGAGDWAYVKGRFKLYLQTDKGDSLLDKGKMLDIRKRSADGLWRVHRDMFNSDLPFDTRGYE